MSDLRKNLIRVASELPKGSDGRKKILALLKESRIPPSLQREWDKTIKRFSDQWKSEDDALDVAIDHAADEIGTDDQGAVDKLAKEMLAYLKKKYPNVKLKR